MCMWVVWFNCTLLYSMIINYDIVVYLRPLFPSPSFRQFFVECYHPLPAASSHASSSHQRASDVLAILFKKMWASDK